MQHKVGGKMGREEKLRIALDKKKRKAIHGCQTLFRRATVHQVGAMRHYVGWVISLKNQLLLKSVCSCLVQSSSLP